MSNLSVFKRLSALLFLLICISFTQATPINQTATEVSQHVTQKQTTLVAKKVDASTSTKLNQQESLKQELPPPALPKAPLTKPLPDVKIEEKKTQTNYPWLELRTNKTLLQRFNKSQLLNETVVPFLKKCDSIEAASKVVPDPELNLCPVYFDNVIRLNETSLADSINSNELEAFINDSLKNSKFCGSSFLSVNSTSAHFNFTKEVQDFFSADMTRACFQYCYEQNPKAPLRKSCAAIAFMGTKLKKTEVDPATILTKNQDEEADPSNNDAASEYGDNPFNEEEDLPVHQPKPQLTSDVKQKVAPEEAPEVVKTENFNIPVSANVINEEPDPSMKYFAFATFIICVVYFGWHYRSKILGLIVEGRRSQRGRGGGGRGSRKHTASYRKLDSNLEEAINSSTSSRSNSQIIY